MNGINEPSGDGYHAWVAVDDLLLRDDLMEGCRVPLEHIAAKDIPPYEAPLHVAAYAQDGMNGIGERAGDGYHAWVAVDNLILRIGEPEGDGYQACVAVDNLILNGLIM